MFSQTVRRARSTTSSTICTPAVVHPHRRWFATRDPGTRTHRERARPKVKTHKMKVMNTPVAKFRFFEHDLLSRDQLLHKFINHMMRSGKKEHAEAIVYAALKKVKLRLRNQRENELIAPLRDDLVKRLTSLSLEAQQERVARCAHLPERARFYELMLSVVEPDDSLGPLRTFRSSPKLDIENNEQTSSPLASRSANTEPSTSSQQSAQSTDALADVPPGVEYVTDAAEESGEVDILDRDSLDIFAELMRKVTPQMGVLRRYGGGRSSSVFTIPIPLTTKQGGYHACRFVIHSMRVRTERNLVERLTNELLDIHRGSARSLIERQNMHKLAIENRGLAHFRW